MSANGVDAATEAKANLVKQDLSTLQAEIDDVAHIVVMHEHGNELQSLSTYLDRVQDTLSRDIEAKAANQIASMTAQLEAMCGRAEQIGSLTTLYQRLDNYMQDARSQGSGTPPSAATNLHAITRDNEAEQALTRLKQYLGLVDNSVRSMQDPERIHISFEHVQEQFDQVLAVQKAQLGHFSGLGTAATEKSTSAVEIHAVRLEELEKEIIEVTAELDRYRTS